MLDFLTRPVRGIGRLLRLKFKQGIGDLGYGIKRLGPAANLIPGVGPLAAAGITAAGSVMDKVDDPGGLKSWKPLKDTAVPAGLAYGAGVAMGHGTGLGRGVGSASKAFAPSGIPEPNVVQSIAPNIRPVGMSPDLTIPGWTMGTATAPAIESVAAARDFAPHMVQSMAPPPSPRIMAGRVPTSAEFLSGGRSMAPSGGPSVASRLASGFRRDPMPYMMGGQLLTGAMGAYQEGKALDYQRQVEEEERQRELAMQENMRRILAQSGIGDKIVQMMANRAGAY